MISFLKGAIAETFSDHIVLECNNIGYNIFVTSDFLSNYAHVGDIVKINTHMNVKEDSMTLYGFISRDELELFRLLINVSGIGPKGAMSILSYMSADNLRMAILSDDSKAIAKSPGIGAKTASKVILELKDKMSIEDITSNNTNLPSTKLPITNNNIKEAIEALTSLGYSASESLKAIKKADISEDMSVENVIKIALKNIL